MNVLVYTKKDCPSCIKAKSLLNIRGIQFRESVIGEDILREDFTATFPEVRTAPFIIIDGVKVGGFEQLREYLDNKPELLQG
ncbi:GrxC Glutaredoxin and related proteins [uncultured Caudovirales phage]|uniref:GrxC Glutaredoxin and related proteins n=1 Tax=uncultured Caudovirales phage TaxID=2100421 RepID=A0A6J5M9U3_9CAUD|nr:GrxC Glutaredoxin and related proteins [uncultured Caudovirales phage]